MAFGENLRKIRIEKGVLVQELASKIEVTKEEIMAWENNESSPSAETIRKIAIFFNVSTDYLLLNKEDKELYNNIKQDDSYLTKKIFKITALVIYTILFVRFCHISINAYLHSQASLFYLLKFMLVLILSPILIWKFSYNKKTNIFILVASNTLWVLFWGINQLRVQDMFVIFIVYYVIPYILPFAASTILLYFAFKNTRTHIPKVNENTYQVLAIKAFDDKMYDTAAMYFKILSKKCNNSNPIYCEYIIRCYSDNLTKFFPEKFGEIEKYYPSTKRTPEINSYISKIRLYEKIKIYTMDIPSKLSYQSYNNLLSVYGLKVKRYQQDSLLKETEKDIIKKHFQDVAKYLAENLSNVLSLCSSDEKDIINSNVEKYLNISF